MIPTELNEYRLLRLEYITLEDFRWKRHRVTRNTRNIFCLKSRVRNRDRQFHIWCYKSNDCCIYALEASNCSQRNEPTKSALMICEKISLFCYTFHQIPDAFFSFPMSFLRIHWVEVHYFFLFFSCEREKEQNQNNPEGNEYTRNTFFVKKQRQFKWIDCYVKRLSWNRQPLRFLQEIEKFFWQQRIVLLCSMKE